MMTFLRVFLALVLFFPVQASAGSCYSHEEAEAEQGLRIHSELMVIGLNCMAMPLFAPKNLYGKYREFTSEYEDLFKTYEDTLLAYFKKEGGGDPAASLNTLRTSLANKFSTDAADMRPDVFCLKFSPRIEAASEMDLKDVRAWASTFEASNPVSRPLCDGEKLARR
jgi:hypothetical protein